MGMLLSDRVEAVAVAQESDEPWQQHDGGGRPNHPSAYVEDGKPAFVGFSSQRNPDRHWYEVTAATPALALLAAALRARAGEG